MTSDRWAPVVESRARRAMGARVRVRTASSGGHLGRRNEDFVGVKGDAVVLLDGAGIPGTEHLCHHGTAWYARALGHALLTGLAGHPSSDLRAVLGSAIAAVADRHRDTCDITDVSSPQATVAVVRFGRHRAEHLVLGDCTLLAGTTTSATPLVVTDDREVALRRTLDPLLVGLGTGSPEHAAALTAYVTRLRAARNRPGGYWLAKDDPAAAEEAVVGSLDLRDDPTVVLLSNGASRLADTYGLLGWPELLRLCHDSGPAAVLTLLRDHEARTDPSGADSDDSTVAVCLPVGEAAAGTTP